MAALDLYARKRRETQGALANKPGFWQHTQKEGEMSELTQRLQKLQDSRADFDAAQKALSGETPSAISLRDGPKYERAYKAYLDAQMAMSAEAHDFMLWATEHDAAAQTEPLSRAA